VRIVAQRVLKYEQRARSSLPSPLTANGLPIRMDGKSLRKRFGALLEIKHRPVNAGMIRELKMQTGTMRLDQNFEDAVHGIAVQFHSRF
jgi:hypothetical protein